MTREEKIKKRQQRAFLRKKKRIEKDAEYVSIARREGDYYNSKYISWGRRKSQGKVYSCEMGYSDCELRGYCNGDC